MNKEASTYLDLVRFIAALLVLIVHSFPPNITGGYLWPLAQYGQTAVMLFFVLSGYVIAYVAYHKETNLKDYTFARVSRLYSVVIPGLIITYLCNMAGDAYIKEAYFGPWHLSVGMDSVQYLATFFMIQDIWYWFLPPRNNGPFWSITYEAVYYAMFAAAFYVRNIKAKVGLFVGFMVLAGPTVSSLFPIWLLGVLAYWINIRWEFRLRAIIAWPVFFGTIVLMVFSPDYRDIYDSTSSTIITRESVVGDYLDGLLFFLHLVAMPSVVSYFAKPLLLFRKPIVYLASGSFSLYLFHQPLVRFFAGVSPFIEEPGSPANVFFVYAMTFLIVYGIGRPIENSKYTLNNFLRRCTRQETIQRK